FEVVETLEQLLQRERRLVDVFGGLLEQVEEDVFLGEEGEHAGLGEGLRDWSSERIRAHAAQRGAILTFLEVRVKEKARKAPRGRDEAMCKSRQRPPRGGDPVAVLSRDPGGGAWWRSPHGRTRA